MIALVEERRAQVGVAPLCSALGLARAFYRRRVGPPPVVPVPRERRPPRQALTPAERDGVLALLHEGQFVDLPPAQVWAQMLDAAQAPLCSIDREGAPSLNSAIHCLILLDWLRPARTEVRDASCALYSSSPRLQVRQ